MRTVPGTSRPTGAGASWGHSCTERWRTRCPMPSAPPSRTGGAGDRDGGRRRPVDVAGRVAHRAYADLPLTIVVFNNSALSLVELELVEGLPPYRTSNGNVNYANIAAGGLEAVRITDPHELRAGLAKALESYAPTLVDVVTDSNVLSLPPHVTGQQIRGFARRPPPDTWARATTNLTHWAAGVGWGAQYGLLAPRTARPWQLAVSLGTAAWLARATWCSRSRRSTCRSGTTTRASWAKTSRLTCCTASLRASHSQLSHGRCNDKRRIYRPDSSS
jgi:Thiamine pyrophosphate enzyme, C-terminal TPP binding domain